MNIDIIRPVSLLYKSSKNKELNNFFNLECMEINDLRNHYFNTNPYIDLVAYKNIIHCIVKLLRVDNKVIKFEKQSELKKQLMLYINEFKLKQNNLVDNEYKSSLQDIFVEINKMINTNSYNSFKLLNKIFKILSNMGSLFISVNFIVLIISVVSNKSFIECKKVILLSSDNNKLNHIMLASHISLILVILNKILNNHFKNIPINIIGKIFKKKDNYFYLDANNQFLKSLKDDVANNKIVSSILFANNDDIIEYDYEFLGSLLNCIAIFLSCLELLVLCF